MTQETEQKLAIEHLTKRLSEPGAFRFDDEKHLRVMLAAAPSPDTGKMGGEETEVERLKAKLRNVVSHATGGNCLEGDDLSLNEISVRITQFRNKLYEAGKQAVAPVSVGDGEAVAWRERLVNPSGLTGSWIILNHEPSSQRELPDGVTVEVQPLYTHPSDPSATERMRAALSDLIRHFEDGDAHDEGAFDESCPSCVALAEARAALGEA